MQQVILIVTDRLLLADLEAAFSACAHVSQCRSLRHAARVLRLNSVGTVVIELCDTHGKSTAMTITALRREFPTVRILGVVHTARSTELLEIVPATRAGLDDLLILPPGRPDVRGSWYAAALDALGRVRVRSAEADVLAALSEVVCDDVFSAMGFAVRHAREPWDVGTFSKTLGVHRSTLVRRLKRAGGLHPSSLLLWARLLLAARLIEEPGRTVRGIAADVGFPSSLALRRALRRTVGVSPSDLRRRTSLQFTIDRFAACVVPPAPRQLRA